MARGTYGRGVIIRIEWKYMDIAVEGPRRKDGNGYGWMGTTTQCAKLVKPPLKERHNTSRWDPSRKAPREQNWLILVGVESATTRWMESNTTVGGRRIKRESNQGIKNYV